MTEQTALHLSVEPVPTEGEKWLDRLRAELYRRYRGQRVNADHAAALMAESKRWVRPATVHPNTMGALFSGWSDCVPVMVGEGEDRVQLTTTTRRGNNTIRVWWIPDRGTVALLEDVA